MTITPTITTKQGPMMQAEYRQRLLNGAFMIRGAGIFQQDKDVFRRDDGTVTPGYRNFRGSVESTGQFALNQKWVWGWDAVKLTDKTFFQDYNVSIRATPIDPFQTGRTEGTSQLYLTGKGDRSFFDIRAMHFYGFSQFDNQKRNCRHPSGDGLQIHLRPAGAGRRARLQAQPHEPVSRSDASFDPITTHGANLRPVRTAVRRSRGQEYQQLPAARRSRHLRALLGGTELETQHHRFLRADFHARSPMCAPTSPRWTSGLIPASRIIIDIGESSFVRAMPTVGLEYRYPFISVQSWGTQTIEPIAQIIARPNEHLIGKLPNEDAQSLIFDDSNLFRVDKFSGWDRQEGGGRAQCRRAIYRAAQSRRLLQRAVRAVLPPVRRPNSYAVGDITNTGLNSGLDTRPLRLCGARFAISPTAF